MDLKKVVFVTGVMGNGGAERVIANVSNALVERGVDVMILTVYGRRCDYVLDEKVKLKAVVCNNKVKLLRPFERIKKLKKAIKEYSPECVISFLADVNIYTLYATKGMDIPVIVSERNDPNNDPEKKWIRKLRDRVYRKADGFVFQTKDAKEYFDGKLPADSSSVIIPNPITSGLPYRNYKGGQKRLITASRLNAQKNLPMMIKAVGALREKGYDVILDIFGDGPDREVLEKYIGELNLSDTVFLRGFSKEVHKEMASSYAFLLSSDYEGISNSMLEALAIGLPVVVTDCPIGGARQFVRSGENGLLVPVRDTSAFTEAIEKVVSDEEYAALIGESAKDVRNVLQIDKITDLWIDFIIKTIKGV